MRFHHASRLKWFSSLLASRGGLVLLVLFVAVMALLVAVWRRGFFSPQKSRETIGLEALAAAYPYRPLEARLSGLRHAPFISPRGETSDFDQAARDQAEKLLLDANAEKSTATTRQALGQFHLMSGSPAKSIKLLEEALKQDPNNASLHNDYGVALLELSRTADAGDNTLHYLVRSLEQFEVGLGFDANNVEALHNRALVLEQLKKLPQQRNKAWQSYLSVESDPAWAAEARRKLELFSQTDLPPLSQQEVLARFLSAALTQDEELTWHELTSNKEMITGGFIPQSVANAFVIASTSGDRAEAQKLLEALRYAGKLELAKARDPFVSQMAGYYGNTTREQQKTLAAAYLLIKSGYEACLNANYDDTPFVKARELFFRAGDVWNAKISDYWIAYCLSQQGKKSDLDESTKLLQTLAGYAKAMGYHWLNGQATCWLANNYSDLGEYSKSIETYRESLATVEAIDDVYNQQKILSQWGNIYTRLNQPELSLQYNWRALQLVKPQSSLRQTWRIYVYTARALTDLKLLAAATQFQEEMLNLALNVIKDPAVSHYSYLYLSQVQGGKKNFPAAFQFAEESLKFAESVTDAQNKRKLQTGALMQLAHLRRQSGLLQDALNTYSQVLETATSMDLRLHWLEAYKGKLLCYDALEDSGNLDAELPRVIKEFEAYRQRITDDKDRITFFDLQQSVYDLAINHAVKSNDYTRALDYSEQSRARSLLQMLKSRTQSEASGLATTTLNLEEIKKQLAADLQVLQFAVLDDKLVAWLITNNSIDSQTYKISAKDLSALVTEYVSGISAGPGQAEKLRPLSQRLYDTLIKPFGQKLDPRKVLCIVPDKTLSYVPFAALVSSETQKYLIEEFVLFTTPSLNVLLLCNGNGRNYARRDAESLLAIGNPAFDRQGNPELDDLPSAAREAKGIADKYSGSYSLVDEDATKPAVEKRLPVADIIHFAGHYVTNRSQPLLSRLVLAKQQGSTNPDLTLEDLLNLRLPRAKLVVLSACETSGKEYFKGEGVIGIARTFIKLGVPLVIASQWSVESESTAILMLKFHESRKSGQSSIRALHSAQLAMLETNGTLQDPYYWAAFTPLGGYVDF